MIQKNILQSRNDLINDFISDRCAMYKFYPQELIALINGGLTVSQIGLAPLPVGPTGEPVSQMVPRVYAINATASKENQKAAFEYIKYMISKETRIKEWKLQEKYGILTPSVPIWKGLYQSDHVQIPEQWSKSIEEQSKYARPEPFFPYWDKVKQYLVQPIQAVLLNKNADPREELTKCAERVQRDILDKINL